MASPAKHPILVVDDEAEVLSLLRGLLRKEYEFHTALGPHEALQILRRRYSMCLT
jgi:CheY-like chemotaxis protein